MHAWQHICLLFLLQNMLDLAVDNLFCTPMFSLWCWIWIMNMKIQTCLLTSGILHKSDEVPKTGDDFDFFNLILGRMLTEKKYSKMNSTSIENSLHHDLVASGPDAARKASHLACIFISILDAIKLKMPLSKIHCNFL